MGRLDKAFQDITAGSGGIATVLLSQTQQPEGEVVDAAWGGLAALTQHQWGLMSCAGTPGFCELLLDRCRFNATPSDESRRITPNHATFNPE